MTMNVFNPDGSIALTQIIGAHDQVRAVLNKAGYELGLIKPDYEVLQAPVVATTMTIQLPNGETMFDNQLDFMPS